MSLPASYEGFTGANVSVIISVSHLRDSHVMHIKADGDSSVSQMTDSVTRPGLVTVFITHLIGHLW